MRPADRGGPTRGPVGWGDALTAAALLRLSTSEQVEALLGLLHLALPPNEEEFPPAVQPITAPSPTDASAGTRWAGPPVEDDDLPFPPDRRTVAEPLPDEPVELVVGEAPPLDTRARQPGSLPYEPPVDAILLRAAITMLVRRVRPSDAIDVQRAVDLVAEQRPLVALPRLAEASTDRGACILADVGPGMLPYLQDVAALTEEVERVVGEPQAVVEWVSGVADEPILDDDGWTRVLEPGRPMVVVSGLGATPAPGAAATGVRWLAFADAARKAGADVVALVPYKGRTWPAALAAAMRIVAWDDLADVGRGHG